MTDDARTAYFAGAGARAFAALAEAALQPVADAVADRLPSLPDGAQVVDLACGAGEPGLTVLRRRPGVRLLGVDASPDMLALARAQADGSRARFGSARFVEGDLADLPLPAACADAVVARFGFLSHGDVPRSVSELARVARPGCAFSVAVWDRTALNPVAHSAMEGLRGLVDDDLLPPLDEQDRRAVDEVASAALVAIGVDDLSTELVTWTMAFDGFEALWSIVSGPGIWQGASAALGEAGRAEFRRRYRARLEPHVGADGSYAVPVSYRLLWGRV